MKLIILVIAAIIIVKAARIVIIVILEGVLRILHTKKSEAFTHKSSYREAFIMECSKDMLKESNYAKNLDKAIKKNDKAQKKLLRREQKIREKLSKLKI